MSNPFPEATNPALPPPLSEAPSGALSSEAGLQLNYVLKVVEDMPHIVFTHIRALIPSPGELPGTDSGIVEDAEGKTILTSTTVEGQTRTQTMQSDVVEKADDGFGQDFSFEVSSKPDEPPYRRLGISNIGGKITITFPKTIGDKAFSASVTLDSNSRQIYAYGYIYDLSEPKDLPLLIAVDNDTIFGAAGAVAKLQTQLQSMNR